MRAPIRANPRLGTVRRSPPVSLALRPGLNPKLGLWLTLMIVWALVSSFRYYYDGLNRLMAQNSSSASNPEYDTFNAINKTAQSHDYFGAYDTVSYTYDARNRLKHRGVAAMTTSGSWGLTDNNDSPGEGIGYDYSYDAGGNLLAVKSTMLFASGGVPNTNVAYAYDNLNRQVLEIQGPAISNISSVSANGTNVPSGVSGGFVNSYTYDAAGNRLTATYGVGRSDARELTSAYDNLNRVKSISEQLVSASGAERQTYYHYDAAGNRVALVQPNYGYVETSFDALGRQAEVEGYKPSAESGELYDFALGYDAFGNLQEQVETYPAGQLGNRTVTLGYDGADRLTTETMLTGTTNITSAYEYDSANDRTSKVTTQQIGNATATTLVNDVYSYLPGNRLQFVDHYTGGSLTAREHYNVQADGIGHGAVTFWDHYSVSGNTATLQSTWKYNYDFDNRLVEVAKMDSGHLSGQGGFYAYAYDYRGRRVARESLTDWVSAVFSGGTDVREYRASQTAYSYSWQWWAQVIWQMPTWNVGNVTSAPSVEYVRGSDWGGGVGGVLYSLHSDNAQYYHYDGRGDVVAQTTGSLGSLVYQSAYNAYGEHNPSGTSFVPAAAGTQEWTLSGATTDDLRANTKEEDPTGVSMQGQRPLIIGTNTWMTPDPMGMIDGTNMYGYCKMNPMTSFDPEGLLTASQVSAFSGSMADSMHSSNNTGVGGFFNEFAADFWDTVHSASTPQSYADNYHSSVNRIAKVSEDKSTGTVLLATGGEMVGLNDLAEASSDTDVYGNSQSGTQRLMKLDAGVMKGASTVAVADQMAVAVDANAATKAASTDVKPTPPATNAPANDTVTVYRGVASDHPGYADALEGKATPRGGHSNPDLHNSGDTKSTFTSWTPNEYVADSFATTTQDGV